MKDEVPSLIVLPPSHFCERARWALDHAGIAYIEKRWAVGLHVPLTRRIAPRTTLPILVIGKHVIQGSGKILDWTGMPGGDQALEQRFETKVGPLVRQFIYAAILNDPGSGVLGELLRGVSPSQTFLARLAWPATRRAMLSSMRAHRALLPALKSELEAELEWFEARLQGRSYLVGDQFRRADLTAASLLAPVARPSSSALYRRTVVNETLEAALGSWRSRPALQWVEGVYAADRDRRFVLSGGNFTAVCPS